MSTKHALLTAAIAKTRDNLGDPNSAYDIHFACDGLDGQLGMSATDWLAYYDDGYHRDAPVAPASPEIVLATFTPTPVAINCYPSAEAAEQARVARCLDETYRPMTWDEYEAGQKAHYLATPLREISAEHFDNMLNILPPVAWEHRDGVERFMLSEAEAGSIHSQFAKRGDRHFGRMVDVRDRSTWITGDECDGLAPGFAAREEARRSSSRTGGLS